MMRFILIVVLVASLIGCGQPSVSGQYIAADDRGAVMLRLVEAPDQTVSGELDFASIDASGKIKRTQKQVTGSADHDGITLTAESDSLVEGRTEYTGSVDGTAITLTGPNGKLFLRRGDSDTFDRALARLKTVSE